MTLETVVFPQGPFGYSNNKELYSMGGGGGAWSFGLTLEDKSLLEVLDHKIDQQTNCLHENWDQYSSSSSVMQNVKEYYWDRHNSSPEACTVLPTLEIPSVPARTTQGRRKRRRNRKCKNKEEVENQRMTHIAVERNRRKQMNEYLAALRSLMPSSYVQRGDQASIVGGAINFVKELEHHLQTLEAGRQRKMKQEPDENGFSNSPFAKFFSYPQYSTSASHSNNSPGTAVADIEVTMVESHASLKILSKRRPKQLLKMVAGFQSLRLTVLHLNVTTVDQLVLYSVIVKVEDGCQLTTVDEIAAAVNQMVGRIEEESLMLS